MSEIYVSTDVETDGPIPGPHSMLSLASAAFLSDGMLHSTFESNLETLPRASGDPEVMKWWEGHPDAWQACRENPRSPTQVMADYCSWLDELPGIPVFVAYPAGFDFMFVYWYLITFAGRSPFSRRALDMRSYAMALLRSEYSESAKANMPSDWHSDRPHTHVALDDAIGQGELFCRMLAEVRG
jgi:hypothetical protein